MYGHGSFSGPVTGTLNWSNSAQDPDSGSSKWSTDEPLPLFAAFTQESRDTLKAGQAVPTPKATGISYKQLANAIQSGASTSVSASESFEITINAVKYTGNSTVTITLRPPSTQLDIEPADEATYEKWMPVPNADDAGSASGEFPPSTPVVVHAVFVDKSKPANAGGGETKPNSPLAGQIDFELINVSKNTGVCMNYPFNGALVGKPGLYFSQTQPAGIKYIDEQHVQTTGSVLEASVTINARDTGAYGEVQATSTVGTNKFTAACVRTGKPSLSVPMDDDNNHIADVWDKAHNVAGKDPTWDACNTPSGMRTTGDGMALYDKYRGLLLDDGTGIETFQRIDPSVRNLFVYVPLSQASRTAFVAGVGAYSRVTGIKTNFLHDATRMNPKGAADQSGGNITFNRSPFSAPIAVYCVIVLDDGNAADDRPGSTDGMDFADPYTRYSPFDVKACIVRKAACQAQVDKFISWAAGPIGSYAATAKLQNLDLKQVVQEAKQNETTLVTELMEFVTMHELGHATGAAHHGMELLAGYVKGTIPLPPNTTLEQLQVQYAASGSTSCPM